MGTQLERLERYEASREFSWGALGGIGRRLGCKNGTKRASRVLTGAKWRPFKMHGKKAKMSFELMGSLLRAPWAVQIASKAS